MQVLLPNPKAGTKGHLPGYDDQPSWLLTSPCPSPVALRRGSSWLYSTLIVMQRPSSCLRRAMPPMASLALRGTAKEFTSKSYLLLTPAEACNFTPYSYRETSHLWQQNGGTHTCNIALSHAIVECWRLGELLCGGMLCDKGVPECNCAHLICSQGSCFTGAAGRCQSATRLAPPKAMRLYPDNTQPLRLLKMVYTAVLPDYQLAVGR